MGNDLSKPLACGPGGESGKILPVEVDFLVLLLKGGLARRLALLANYGRMMRAPVLVILLTALSPAGAADWVRPGLSTNQTVWGIRGGLLWAVPPAGFRPGEPRGLIRLGYPVLPGGGYDLINFIAIEPIVKGRRGFSELEHSNLDGAAGKRIWIQSEGDEIDRGSGKLQKGTNGAEELEVKLGSEKFDNGAHVGLVVRQRSDRPGEIEFGIFEEPDSAALDYCILSATMGNMARTRQLWLKDEVVRSPGLYRGYRESGFAPHKEYPLPRLHRTGSDGVLVAITNDEKDPTAVYPFGNSQLWHYAGFKVTQYWAKGAGTFRDDLHVAVNGRYTYWRSTQPIPGGVAFENFEMRERFYAGQRFIFGITRSTPPELGFGK